MGKTISIETIYDNGEDWGNNNGGDSPRCKQVFKLDTGTPSESGTDPSTDGLKDSGATPALSPVVVVEMPATMAEDSGCGLQFEVSSDENRGKEHLFNKFLTEMEREEHSPPSTESQTKQRTGEERETSLPSTQDQMALSSSIAQMVADRLHMGSDSAVPSSGYGRMDCYKFSTDTPQMTPEYLAQKLQDVEEPDNDLLNPDETTPTNNKTTSKSDLSIGNLISGEDETHLPSLLLTPPQMPLVTSDHASLTQLGLAVGSLGTSASTGNLSSSYYQDNEGYLHVSLATNSGQTQSVHHQSFDALTKSL